EPTARRLVLSKPGGRVLKPFRWQNRTNGVARVVLRSGGHRSRACLAFRAEQHVRGPRACLIATSPLSSRPVSTRWWRSPRGLLGGQYQAGPRVRLSDVIDEEPGQIYDILREGRSNPAWGLLPRPGTARVYLYPNARGGLVIADVVRLDKWHTE